MLWSIANTLLITSVSIFWFYGLKEAENGKGSARNVNVSVSGEKTVVQEPVVYENKLVSRRKRLLAFFLTFAWVHMIFFPPLFLKEARNAFKALLESANIGSDWTWDQVSWLVCIFF